MAVKTNAQLAAFFETGDQPSQAEFGHLIDTIVPTSVLLTDADTTLTETANGMRMNILPDLGANRTFSIPTPSAAGVWYRFIYGGAAADAALKNLPIPKLPSVTGPVAPRSTRSGLGVPQF